MADKSMMDSFDLKVPEELLSAATREPKPKNEQLKVDGWKNSWMSRLSELLVGKD